MWMGVGQGDHVKTVPISGDKVKTECMGCWWCEGRLAGTCGGESCMAGGRVESCAVLW